jgi:hypothetical protein
VFLVGEYRRLEIGRQADMKQVRRLLRWTERLRIGPRNTPGG